MSVFARVTRHLAAAALLAPRSLVAIRSVVALLLRPGARHHESGRGRGLGRGPAAAVGVLVCSALLGAGVTPAGATEGADRAGTMVGGFGVGDGLEATIDPRDGAGMFSVPAAGLALRWDSRLISAGDRTGFGAGWTVGVSAVGVTGGVRVVLASGRVLDADATSPTGLADHATRDLRFEQHADGWLEARPDGSVDRRPARFSLHELGGTTTWYDAEGRAIARSGADGTRIDWIWSPGAPGRLARVVDPNGVRTDLDWDQHTDEARIRVAANLPEEAGARREWRVRFDHDGVREIVDPLGGRTELVYDGGLLAQFSTVSGARTEVDWQSFADGVPRVGRVRTLDSAGRELSARHWRGVDDRTASGWPLIASPVVAAPGSDYATELGDGATTVRSTFDGSHHLRRRDVELSTTTGSRVAQSQIFEYDDPNGYAEQPAAAPVAEGRPTSSSVVVVDDRGASNTTTVRLAYDEFGRVIRETAADGGVTTTEYDSSTPVGAVPTAPPVGLPLSRTVTTADGLVTKTVSTLNAARTAVVATEAQHGRVGEALTTGERTEYVVDADGFVSEERLIAADGGAAVLTRRTRVIDLARGTQTTTTVSGTGTATEATTSETVSLAHGGVVRATSATGAATTAHYDPVGRLTASIDAAGNETRTEYESRQQHGRNATTTTRPDGVAVTDETDELGRLVRRSDNILDGAPQAGHVRVAEVRAYPDARTARITDAWGAVTEAVQDAFGREVRSTAANGLVRVTEYDDVAGTVTSGFTPTGDLADAERVTTEHRDVHGRPTETTGHRADGEAVPATTAAYDGLGRTVARSDGRVDETVRLDASGRPVATIVAPTGAPAITPTGGAMTRSAPRLERGPITADRRFDALGHGVQKTLSEGTERVEGGRRSVDPLGRVLEQTDRAHRTTAYRYTPDGLVERLETSAGEVTETTFDPVTRQVSRVTSSTPGRATVTTATEYDPVTGLPVAVFDPADRAASEISYRHDAFGNVTNVSYPDGSAIEHEYDLHGRLESTTDSAGVTTRFAYDDVGLLVTASQSRAERADAGFETLAEVGYEYDDYGRVARLDRGNGVSTAYTFTSSGDVASETTRHGVMMRSARTYEYDAHGNLSTRVDRVVDEGGETATTTTYTYDAFNRLRSSRVHDGASAESPIVRERAYEVSVAGMITAETIVEAPGRPEAHTTERRFEYSPGGELAAVVSDDVRTHQTYDEAGRLTVGADGSTLTYDAAGRPSTRRSGDTTTEYRYWVDGSRRSLTTTDAASGRSASISFYWNGDVLLSERHSEAGSEGTASYLNAATRHARLTMAGDESAGIGYYDTDRRGDVTELTDAAGDTTERYTYDDYGVTARLAASTPDQADAPRDGLHRNPFRYAGELQDPDGTYRLGGVRSYDPATRSFTTPDPADLFADYAYADLNPIAKIDPSGRNAQDVGTRGMVEAIGWMGFGFSLIADGVIIASALFTGGWSLTGLGIVNIAVQTTTATIAAIRIADAVAPDTITDEQSRSLAVSDAGIGIAGALLGIVQGVMAWVEGAAARMVFRKVGQTLAEAERELAPTYAPIARFRSEALELGKQRSETIVALMRGTNGLPPLPREIALKIADDNFVEPGRALLRGIDQWNGPSAGSLAAFERGVEWAAQDFERHLRNTAVLNRPFRSWRATQSTNEARTALSSHDAKVRTGLAGLRQRLAGVLPPGVEPDPIDATLILPT